VDILPHEKKIYEFEQSIQQVKEQNKEHLVLSPEELKKLEKKLDNLKKKVYSELTPAEKVSIARHPARPRSMHYISNICDSFTELFGDRLFGDDHAIVTGIATIGGEKFVVIGQEKGANTQERMYRNFGMPHPEGFRKALRVMKLAEKFHLPVLSFVDTTGAFPGLDAEQRGQSWAIAQNLMEMANLSTPIIVVVIGEGASGGALGVGIGDAMGMLEHSYFSVITPEGCASILWKDINYSAHAAEMLKLTAQDMLKLRVIDDIIAEPLGGAHHNPKIVYANVKKYALERAAELTVIPTEQLLARRYQKLRQIGQFSSNSQDSITI
jgi:acetyl-CoA carboxylase carboxyl transferase subunit alpha